MVVDNDPPATPQEGVDIFYLVVDVVVTYGFSIWWKFDLVDLERCYSEWLTDELVERTRGGVRAATWCDRCGVDDSVGHIQEFTAWLRIAIRGAFFGVAGGPLKYARRSPEVQSFFVHRA